MNTKIFEYIKTPDKKNFLIFAGSLVICLSVAVIGIFITKNSIASTSLIWYESLFKPALTPSVEFFQGVWVFLYLLSGISLYFVLNSENIDEQSILKKVRINLELCSNKSSKRQALIILGIQFFLSFLLIPVFLGLMSALGGFIISVLIWMSVCLTFYKFYKITVPAALLTIPAILWSAYLVGLNLTFFMLN